MTTREQMIEAIYQIVTPSIEVFKPNNDGIWQNVIIIWDVLDYKEKEINNFKWQHHWSELEYFIRNLSKVWKEKRKPIEEQSDDCIKFVFDNL